MTVCWSKFNTGYEVSTDGQIRSLTRKIIRKDTGTVVTICGRVMKQQKHRDGYLKIDISVGGERFVYFIHRLVAQAFITNPDNLPQVNHIDGNKANNHVSNLEWTNNSGNQLHAIKVGLRKIKVGKEANRFEGTVHAWDNCGKLVASMNGNIEMASSGFDFRLVSACLKGKRKTHRGCTFTKTFEKEI